MVLRVVRALSRDGALRLWTVVAVTWPVFLAACKARDGSASGPVADGAAASMASASTASMAPNDAGAVASAALLARRPLRNKAAYVPPQCFTNTRGADGKAKNPCYVCHTRSEPPNFVDDEDLQLTLKLPLPTAHNPWTNLLSPPIEHTPPQSDDEILAYVRQSNYLEGDGTIALARTLENVPAAWDVNGNGRWDGFVPDVHYALDAQGFDHGPDGAPTGWRAFAYYPFPGTFFPTNGSADDVFVRLDPVLRQDAAGAYDARIYAINLAIVEALVTRADVAIDPVDEAPLGVDLDLDGHVGTAKRVAFDSANDGRGGTRMKYVGRARDLLEHGQLPIAVGLFPVHTEFFHTVRYLDVGPDGAVTMAARMKEVRYAKKARWMSYEQLKRQAVIETGITASANDRTHKVEWFNEVGIPNEVGWYFQAFIEARDGSLRPQSMEESAFCQGCHGGVGATVDSTFVFARKLGAAAPARGWFHWTQHGLAGLAEPRRRDGQYEYTLYLQQAGAGDELRSNDEVTARFFDEHGALRRAEVDSLHADIARLLLPTQARALDLDRAYRAVVLDQSFDHGRDAVLARSPNILADPKIDDKTGIVHPVVAMRLAR
jgi:hypothetical protein